ncbi:MAG: hypothetical protein DME26_04085 [Verrucomicrobia bacterium]|nr:MAG: hypothetical protein DME26_04085 [Verrucomicrobiota bacterium]
MAYWRLGETSGTVAHDYVGGHDGAYFKATLNQPGYSVVDSDTAVAFSGLNSYVGNISGTEINFSGHTNFSLEVWVNGAAAAPDESTIIAKGTGSSGTTATEQFSIDVVGGGYRFFTRGGNNSFFDAVATDPTSGLPVGPDGTWQHLVAVYDDLNTLGGGQMMYLYVNGELKGTHAPRAAGLRPSTSPVSIGSKHLGNNPDYDGTFPGTIDEVTVYNYALSAASIQAHYAAAYGSSLAPLINKQPVPVTNYVSLPASFSVGAIGTIPLTYQWKKGGVDIAGATGSSYTINSLALSDAGNYSVAVGNSIGTTNSATVSLTVLPAPTSAPAISGLVLHLPFDNNLTDATGRGNNGTAIHTTTTTSNAATATFVTDGKLGQALHYSSDMGAYPGPTTTNNNYVTLGVRPDLQFSSNVNFTVAYWIRLPANYIGGDLPFFTDTVGSTFGSGYVFAPSYGAGATSANTGKDAGGWAASFYDTAGNGVGVYGDIGSINDGGWHHLVHVINRTSGMVTYLDGVLAHSRKQAGTSASAAGNVDSTPPNPATIGQDPNGTYGETGSADIDDLGVWRRALTPLEAASVYMAASANGLSFTTSTAISISIQTISSSQVRLIWPAGTLQAADRLDGTYTDISSATSPFTVTSSAATKFYRVRQ